MSKNVVTDSIMFLSAARKAISETVYFSENDPDDILEMKNFIMNEATDYEVMSLLVDNEMPEYRYNEEAEMALWEKLKNDVYENSNILSEKINNDSLESIINEIGPISELGLSSAKPILEFQHNNGMLANVLLTEKPAATYASPYAKRGIKGLLKKKPKSTGGMGVTYTSPKPGMMKTVGGKLVKGGKAMDKKVASAAGKVGSKMKTIGGKVSGSKVGQTTSKYAGKVKASASKFGGKVSGSKAGMKVKNIAGKAGGKMKTVGSKIGGSKAGKGVKVAGTKVASVLKNVANKSGASGAARAMKNNKSLTVGAIVTAAIIAYGGIKTYKRFLSKAAKACSGQSGANKTSCMNKYKANALKAQVADLKNAISACDNSSNPQKCKLSVQSKIQKIQNKISSLG